MTAYVVLRFGGLESAQAFIDRTNLLDFEGHDCGEVGIVDTQYSRVVGDRGELEVDLKVRFP